MNWSTRSDGGPDSEWTTAGTGSPAWLAARRTDASLWCLAPELSTFTTTEPEGDVARKTALSWCWANTAVTAIVEFHAPDARSTASSISPITHSRSSTIQPDVGLSAVFLSRC